MSLRTVALGFGAAFEIAGASFAQTSPGIGSHERADQNAAKPPSAVRPANIPGQASLVKDRNLLRPFTPFILRQVEVQGASIDLKALDAGWRPFVGRTMDQAELNKLVTAISDRYGKSDVALYTVLVPDQTFADGVVKLQVIEGYLQGGQIDGVGNPKRISLIQRYLAPLLKEKPLSKSSLQRQVSLIRDMPGLYPTLNFEKGDTVGAVRLRITAAPRSVQLGLGINNRGTALLGHTQGQADLYANSILVGGDQTHATIVTPLEADLFRYYGLSYSVPLNANGTTLQANLGYLDTHPRAIPLKGSAISFGLQASHPLIRSYENNVYLSASVDGVNSDNALLGQTFTHENVRTARIAGSYNRSAKGNVLTLSATASFGISGLGAKEFNPGLSRLDFRKLNVKLVDNLAVSRNVILRLDGFVQATNDILPGSEQVALGGDEFGRAYEAAVIAGDRGVAGSAELAWQPTKRLAKVLRGSEVYTFIDGGEVTYKGRFGAADTHSRLASLGAGVRADIAAKTVVQLEAARGLYNPVFYENREVWRVFAIVKTLF